ncbi:MAG: 5/3-nucleotidase [Chloroflexota bacterium]|nr:5/3-nucleotidase [Chloroflexota bacterium]
MRALVTNDDGIASAGIRALAGAALAAGLEVVVAAPAEEASGSSAALTAVQADGRVVVEQHRLDGLEDVPAYGVAAAPAYIVRIATRGAFGAAPDVVLSGINRGANTGRAVLHSGTVGAALTARTQGLPGLAVSLAGAHPEHWETAAGVAGEVLRHLLAAGEPLVLNLNVPDLPPRRVRGLRRARLAPIGRVQTTITDIGKGYVQIGVAAEEDAEHEPDTDTALVAAGFATVTALHSICERDDVELPGIPRPGDDEGSAVPHQDSVEAAP